jgi:mRNA interferase RelE/StbE
LAYNIQYKKSVQKDLARIGKPEARRLLDKVEKELASHPERYPMLQGPLAGLRKLRMGDYRVIFAILDNDVVILRIGNRRDVYK